MRCVWLSATCSGRSTRASTPKRWRSARKSAPKPLGFRPMRTPRRSPGNPGEETASAILAGMARRIRKERDLGEEQYYPRGFGLKPQIEGQLSEDYRSRIVDYLKTHDFTLKAGDLVFRLAGEFGFCYGVDRAVEYAYETCARFPQRKLFITGEIIHNPHVNQRLKDMGIRFPSGEHA